MARKLKPGTPGTYTHNGITFPCNHYLRLWWENLPLRYDQYGNPLYRYAKCTCGQKVITYPV